MDADEAAAGAHEIEQCRLLRRAHRQFAGGEEHHRAVAAQIFRREYRDVLARRDRESVVRADLLEHRLRGRNDLVAVTGRVGEVEKARVLGL